MIDSTLARWWARPPQYGTSHLFRKKLQLRPVTALEWSCRKLACCCRCSLPMSKVPRYSDGFRLWLTGSLVMALMALMICHVGCRSGCPGFLCSRWNRQISSSYTSGTVEGQQLRSTYLISLSSCMSLTKLPSTIGFSTLAQVRRKVIITFVGILNTVYK